MKIRVTKCDYEEVCKKIEKNRSLPQKPNWFLRQLIRIVSGFELRKVHFRYKKIGMEKLKRREPCLILMNHSSFIDLKICAKIFWNRPYNIVCTSDGFVGKGKLMRKIGCIPTQKFVTDVALFRNMKYALEHLHSSVLLFPEASYSFDGTQTPLPDSLGKALKILQVPVVFVRTHGAFLRDPLYNGLQVRKTDVSAEVIYLLSKKDIEEKTVEELNQILKEAFTFDHFKEQQEQKISISESFRADYLNRVLYKCPHCLVEGQMEGVGKSISCNRCHAKYDLSEYGYLIAQNGKAKFSHIPDWYAWERECVRLEILGKSYGVDLDVDIYMLVNEESIFQVGEGVLKHTSEGFHLKGCNGKIDYKVSSRLMYGLYADYFWYEIGDMVCIGDMEKLFYCFPKNQKDVVAKMRLATEEIYKSLKRKKA